MKLDSGIRDCEMLQVGANKKLPPKVWEAITAAGLHGISREENFLLWSQVLDRLTYIPVTYSHASIDYQLAYQRGHDGDWWDISLILCHDKQPCGVWPLSLSVKDEKWSVTSHGMPVLPPIFMNGFLGKSQKTLVKQCLSVMEELCRAFGIPSWESSESFNGHLESSLSEWHLQSMQLGARPILHHELFIDTSLDMAAIKSGFRKSYKSLISSGMRLWQVGIMSEANAQVWDEFRNFHYQVSGRITRSAESWDLHHQAIAQGDAFLVFLRDRDGKMVGGGFFNATRDESVYGVGVYDRSLFDKPLGHVVQYQAIAEMKNRGVRWYKIGFRPYQGDSPTEKELSIAEFKQGFASHVFPQFILRNDLAT
jgi:FemAB family protein